MKRTDFLKHFADSARIFLATALELFHGSNTLHEVLGVELRVFASDWLHGWSIGLVCRDSPCRSYQLVIGCSVVAVESHARIRKRRVVVLSITSTPKY